MNPMTFSPLLAALACVRGLPEAQLPDALPPPVPSAAALRASIPDGTDGWLAVRDQAVHRIEGLDPTLRAVISMDRQAAPATASGALYGIPVLIKDNIDVAGFPTTAGSLALANNLPPDDGYLVAKLRQAGAIVLGKANLSEWSNFRSSHSSSGWSGVGGQVRNPHVLDRSPCGSSAGSAVAVAAGYVPFAIGTETDGSILCPASINGVVGVKPTVGLVSRDGIVPISHSQDTAGPIAATVRDAAMLLEVLAANDSNDVASGRWPEGHQTKYVDALREDALQGVRIGVADDLTDFLPEVEALFEAAVADLVRLGAQAVPITLVLDESAYAAEEEVLFHEFRPDIERYLATATGPRSLEGLVAFNKDPAHRELLWFGQELFEEVLAHSHAPDAATAYEDAVARLARVGPDTIDAALATHNVVAIVTPTSGAAWTIDWVNGDHYTGGTSTITAVSGYPAVTVPMGMVPVGMVDGLPVGVSFIGTAFDERRLLALAYAYEAGTGHRTVPALTSTLRER